MPITPIVPLRGVPSNLARGTIVPNGGVTLYAGQIIYDAVTDTYSVEGSLGLTLTESIPGLYAVTIPGTGPLDVVSVQASMQLKDIASYAGQIATVYDVDTDARDVWFACYDWSNPGYPGARITTLTAGESIHFLIITGER